MLVLDIETVPIEKEYIVAEKYLAQPNARLKDEEKVAVNLAETTEKRCKQRSLNPFMGKIVCIGVVLPSMAEGSGITFCGPDEKEILRSFWNMIKDRNIPWQTITFNGIGFDLHFLYMRSIINNIKMPIKDFTLKKFYNKPHFDVMQVLSNWAYGEAKSLDFYTEVFELGEVDSEVNGSKVHEWYDAKDFERIGNYCLQDCYRTLALFRVLAPQLAPKNPFRQFKNKKKKDDDIFGPSTDGGY